MKLHPQIAQARAGLVTAVATALLAGCGSAPRLTDEKPGLMERFTPYKVDILQGNVVTREQIARVKPGMTRDEVRDVLGSPMLTDPFHALRWDYVFSVERVGRTVQRHAVTVHFDDNRVSRIEAPDLPSDHEFVRSMARDNPKPDRLPALELTPEQRARLPAPVRSESEAAARPQGAARTYPALEQPR